MPKGRRRWSAHEDAILREEVEMQLASYATAGDGKTYDWNSIAGKILGRSNKDCRKRFYNGVSGGLKKGPWTEEEDRQLKNIVRQHGQMWAVVASQIKTRSADQCAKRWVHSLDPALDRSRWTEQETRLLISAVQTHGRSWKDIQQLHFPNRATNNVKNQHTLIRRKLTDLPNDVAPCCMSTHNGSKDEMTAAGPLGCLQEHSLPNSVAPSVFSSEDLRFDLSPLLRPNEYYLDPTLLSEQLQQPLGSSGPFSPSNMFLDGSMAVESGSDPLENIQIGDSVATSAFSSSEDFGGEAKSKIFDPGRDSRSYPSPLLGPKEPCLDPILLLERPQQPLGSSGAEIPFDVLPDGLVTVDSGSDSLKNVEIGDSMSEGHGLGNIEGIDLALTSDADEQGYPDPEASSGDVSSQATTLLKATITLDDVEPSIVSSIMNILIHSKAKVRFETQDPQG